MVISFRAELYAKRTALLTCSPQSLKICWILFSRITSSRPYTHPPGEPVPNPIHSLSSY